VAAVIGAASAVIGTGLSAVLPPPGGAVGGGWPTGPMIVLTAAALFVVSLAVAPERGVLVALWRRHRLRATVPPGHGSTR
jgi:manganese/zinc/iron transport system permease protein